MTQEEVRLAVPAQPEYLRMTRMLVAGVASRVGFTFDEIDDLRIAIDELCFSLMHASSGGATLTIDCRLQADGLVVEGAGRPGGEQHDPPQLSEMSTRIIGAVVDECQLGYSEDGPTFRFVKHLRPS